MGVGVDRDHAAHVERQVEEVVRRVLALGAAVDLDGGVELRARREDVVGVELRLLPPSAHHLAPGAVPEDVDVGAGRRHDHALGHGVTFHRQLRVHRGDDDVESCQQIVGQVEAAVLQDVDLHAGEDAERRELLVERGDLDQLVGEACGIQSVGDGQPGRVVGHHEVLMTQRPRGAGHVGDRRTPVGPQRVRVAVPLDRGAHGGSLAELDPGRGLELGEIGRGSPCDGVVDHATSRRPDAVEVGDRLVLDTLDEL